MNHYLPILPITAESFGIGIFYFMIGLSMVSVAVWAIVKVVQLIQRSQGMPDDEPPENDEDKSDSEKK